MGRGLRWVGEGAGQLAGEGSEGDDQTGIPLQREGGAAETRGTRGAEVSFVRSFVMAPSRRFTKLPTPHNSASLPPPTPPH